MMKHQFIERLSTFKSNPVQSNTHIQFATPKFYWTRNSVRIFKDFFEGTYASIVFSVFTSKKKFETTDIGKIISANVSNGHIIFSSERTPKRK